MSTKTEQIIKGIIKHGPEILEHCVIDDATQYIERIQNEFLNYPKPKTSIDTNNWFIPDAYKSMDIHEYVLSRTKNDEELRRAKLELELFEKNNMINVLKTMVYIVDTLRKNNIVWGVGRGSSVASFVLHIIGVHKINSIKYNIPLNEFFKGENNG
jgi:DNA polymerase III alpha subunit